MNIAAWLEEIGFGHFAQRFEANAIDEALLAELTDEDLKTLGVGRLGDRKRLLRAIAARHAPEHALDPAAAPAERRGPPAEAERRQVSVLFADLVDFTRLANTLDEEALRELLSEFFDLADAAVCEFGGMVDKHIGDCIMAVFGAPIAHGDDAERAVRAALEIRRRTARLAAPDGSQLEVHIGVASGQVIAGGTGGSQRDNYTVTGASVNLASRLSDHAGPGTILLSDSIQRILGETVSCRSGGAIDVQGFDGPVPIWFLDGMGRHVGSDGEPLVGRRHELEQIDAMFSACRRTGMGGAILLRGDPGIGKSRLLQAVRRAAEDRGFASHLSEVIDFGGGARDDALRILLRSVLDFDITATPADREQRLDALIDGGLLDRDHAPFLRDLLDIDQTVETRALYEAMTNATRNLGKRDTLATLLERLSASRPLLVMVEDVHWADARSLDALAHLSERTSRCPMILVMTTRVANDPIDGRWRSLSGGARLTTIDLGPLSREDAVALLRGRSVNDPALVERCVERAGGNPLFLEQLLNHDATGEAVPGSILNLVQSSMDRLTADDRHALEAASVLGQRLSAEALAHLIDRPSYDCNELIDRGLLSAGEESLRFGHALIRDGVYASILRGPRRALHRRAADWYAERDLVLRAEHLDRAEAEAAPAAYLAAAVAEAEKMREERALALVERALGGSVDPSVRNQAMLLRAGLLRELGRIDEAERAFRLIADGAGDDGVLCRANIGIASCDRIRGGTKTGLRALDAADGLARRLDTERERAEIAFYRGCLMFAAGRVEDCLEQHEASLAHAERAGDLKLAAQAMSGLGDAHYARARMKRALDYFERCSALCREHGFGKIAVGSLHMSAVVRRYRNECRRALEDIRRATAMAVAVGNVRSEMVTLTITAEMSADAGDLKSAFPALDRAQALAERLGARRYAAYIRYQLGRALWQDGERRAEAASVLEEAVAISEETGRHFIGPRALAALALATSANDEVWRRHLALGESILEDGCLAHNVLWFRRDAMEAALAAGDAATARRHADALAAYTRAEPLPWCDFFIARSRALADALEGRSRATSGAAFAELRRQAEAIGLFSAAPALEMAEARSA